MEKQINITDKTELQRQLLNIVDNFKKDIQDFLSENNLDEGNLIVEINSRNAPEDLLYDIETNVPIENQRFHQFLKV